MMAASVDELISDLSADLRPVKRLASPAERAGLWLGAVIVIGVVLAVFVDLAPIAERLRSVPDMWLAVLGCVATTVLGAVAVFHLTLPDRSASWALLPIPGLALWVGGTGLGCLRSWAIPGMHPASVDEAQSCIGFIITLSLPLSGLMFWMVRRGYSMRPNLTAAVGGITVAAAAASLLTLFHPFDAGATDMAVHTVAVAIVVTGNRMLARYL